MALTEANFQEMQAAVRGQQAAIEELRRQNLELRQAAQGGIQMELAQRPGKIRRPLVGL